jgi:sorbitol-specific phosphotransferase system component IIC
MIVVAGLDVAFALVMLFLNILGMSWLRMSETMTGTWGDDVTEDMMKGGFGIMVCIVGILIDAVIILGANKMRNLDSYGFAVAASILSVIPCLSSPCFVLGMPFGIWALVVLMNEDVRNAFSDSEKPPQPSTEGPS